ncbi:MAG: ThiF family adenylyltransferase [Desulfobacterales bacterium]|nr:ThiF family adenylyltransferase [Desulfobacterales bacterium]
MILPSIFFDNDFDEGTIYAIKNPYVFSMVKDNYIGVATTYKNKAGVIVQKIYNNAQHLFFVRSPNPKDIFQYEIDGINESIKGNIKTGRLIKFFGFKIKSEPQPFQNVNELAFYIGNKDEKKGFERIIPYIRNDIKNSDVIYLGIKFPGRRNNEEWQFFSLKKKNNFCYILGDSVDNIIEMLNKFNVFAIYSEEFTEITYHKRNGKRADRSILKNKSVTFIGCGSLGSEIADAIGKAGIGKIQLLDKECLRVHNSVRHLVSVNRIGFPKALAVSEQIIMHNPFVEVVNLKNNYMVDILNSDINVYFLDASVGISTIADDNIEGFLNEQAVINNKTVFYDRALKGGKVARIFRVIPGKDACKNCLSLYYKEKDPCFIEIPEDIEMPTITNECNNPIRPASAADLKLISSITSKLIIDFLQTGNVDMNHWIWTTEKIDRLYFDPQTPFILHSTFIHPHPNCLYCKKDDPVKIVIDKTVISFMENHVHKNVDIETGGVLIGHRLESGDIRVRFASEPGPNAKCLSDYFEKDIEFTQKYIDHKYHELGNNGIYIGEWHYHPLFTNKPSNIDLLSLSNISKQKEYPIHKPIMIILSRKLELSCTVHPFNKPYYFADYLID